MSEPRHEIDDETSSPEYFYAIFNLPVTANAEEIRDRYKQLSLIFHPDKQQDPGLKEIANKKFLQLQKAYEVLSDSTLRQAYDLYGVAGLALVLKSELDGVDIPSFQKELARRKALQEFMRGHQVLRASSTLEVTLDATSLSQPPSQDQNLLGSLWDGVTNIHAPIVGLQNTFSKTIAGHTAVTYTSRATVSRKPRPRTRGPIILSLMHQYSPFLVANARTELFSKPNITLGGTYDDGDNQLSVEGYFAPAFLSVRRPIKRGPKSLFGLLPTFSFHYARRLFPASQTTAQLAFATTLYSPSLTLAIASGQDAAADEESVPDGVVHSPSFTGLSYKRTHWATGVTFLQVIPVWFVQYGIMFREMGLHLKSGLQVGLSPSASVGVTWFFDSSGTVAGLTSLGAKVSVGLTEIALTLRVVYYNEVLRLPIVFSTEFDRNVAFWTTVVPSSCVALCYYFILRPRQRARRLEFFRQARRELREAKADKVRPMEETVNLLRDLATRHMRAEAATDGLIITDARYGPSERDDATKGLDIDVTIPLQALVNTSQLYIPGRRSKAALQGFYDPAPSVNKSLRVHYTFRGRPHYVETPDKMPLVLPQADHLVQ